MTAQDYQINFPYGVTQPPYSQNHPHRGDDRPCPEGTLVTIGSVTIGATGETGYTYGPHLHIQEWIGDYSNTRKPQNSFKPGIVINIDEDGSQGDGSFGKFITIQNADGWNDSYCHLSRIDVKIGQIIGDTVATILDEDNWYNRCNITHLAIRGRDLDRNVFKSFVGQDFLHFVEVCEDDQEAQTVSNWQNVGKTAVNEDWQGQITTLNNQVKVLQKQIKDLEAQLALQSEDTKNLNKLGEALQWFVKRIGLK